ncbi:MAG: NHL repeat-containing protein [Candidatus Eremiobacteraeota bacterium]|nr:NHL repeat-containing protein [Candidatus Eremiobacteraeota bacterium]
MGPKSLGVALALAMVAGCSAGDQRVTPDGSISALVAPAGAARTNLYVANASTVTVYAPGSDRPLRTITKVEPSSIALDSLGNLYVANLRAGTNGNVAVYRAGKSSLWWSISKGVDNPKDLAFDAGDNLYVANSYFDVVVYGPRKTVPSRRIKLFFPDTIAFDRKGNVYIASESSPYGHGRAMVTVFGPKGVLLRTIVAGLNSPDALALNADGYLFVANYGANDVTVYAPGHTAKLRTISEGVRGPDGLKFDSRGNLYVANNAGSTITTYAPGSPHVARTIHNGISHPTALIFDAAGNLYVADSNSVTEYPPGSDVPSRTITKGVQAPIALGFGP